MKLGYLGTDQYGNNFSMSKHPRKELMEQLGYKSARKMYVDTVSGDTRHTGYVIGDHWINVYEVHQWNA